MNLNFTGDRGKIAWLAGCGAAGALVAALLGELWLGASRGATPTVSICLLLDCSGSMSDAKLDEMKAAAAEFVEQHTFPNTQLSVVGFDTTSRVESPLSAERTKTVQAIQQLQIGGSTNMEAGLQAALSSLPKPPGQRFIVIFTDGMPDVMEPALREAQRCRTEEVTLIAVATQDADRDYLVSLTGSPQSVFAANPGEFSKAFEQVDRRLHDLVSTNVSAGGGFGLVRIGIWTALLASGIGLALIAGQNLYLGRRVLSPDEAKWGAIGSLIAGAAAGVGGQFAFSGVADRSAFLVFLGRVAGWLIMGALLGLGLARFIPNLKLNRGLLGGVLGGALGVVGFELLALVLADAPGRLAGAVILGACIGAMIAWIDVLLREAWLEVEYGPGEIRTVSLGREPVTVGSVAGKCTVFVPAPDPTTLRYQLTDGQVFCEDSQLSRRTAVQPDEVRQLGKAKLRVKGQITAMGPAAGAGVSFNSSEWKSRALAWFTKQFKPRGSASSHNDSETAAGPTFTAGKPGSAQAAPRTGLQQDRWLLVVGWEKIPLISGKTLACRLIPGLEPDSQQDVVAEVVPNPQQPGVLGLKNRSRIAWQVTTPEGKALSVDPGRSIRVASGTCVRFGITEGKIITE